MNEIAEWLPISAAILELENVKEDSVPLAQIAVHRKFLCEIACERDRSLELEF